MTQVLVAGMHLEGHKRHFLQRQTVGSLASRAERLVLGEYLYVGQLEQGILTQTGEIIPGVVKCFGRIGVLEQAVQWTGVWWTQEASQRGS